MTPGLLLVLHAVIIPYQELLGNYDLLLCPGGNRNIIPYQELLGNYDCTLAGSLPGVIIPYQELLGNYDLEQLAVRRAMNYTIPRAIREL